jgi:hypothetical protein
VAHPLARFDENVLRAFCAVSHIDRAALTDVQIRQQIRMPLRARGFGLRATAANDVAYLAGLSQALQYMSTTVVDALR